MFLDYLSVSYNYDIFDVAKIQAAGIFRKTFKKIFSAIFSALQNPFLHYEPRVFFNSWFLIYLIQRKRKIPKRNSNAYLSLEQMNN